LKEGKTGHSDGSRRLGTNPKTCTQEGRPFIQAQAEGSVPTCSKNHSSLSAETECHRPPDRSMTNLYLRARKGRPLIQAQAEGPVPIRCQEHNAWARPHREIALDPRWDATCWAGGKEDPHIGNNSIEYSHRRHGREDSSFSLERRMSTNLSIRRRN